MGGDSGDSGGMSKKGGEIVMGELADAWISMAWLLGRGGEVLPCVNMWPGKRRRIFGY